MATYLWPPSAAAGSNASVGPTGTTAPTSATEIGGVNAGNLVPVAVTSTGSLIIDGSGTPIPVSGTVTANQGNPNSVGNAWPVRPTDGTNVQGFTAASEAKVSVTQPLPVGTNSIGTVGLNAGTQVIGHVITDTGSTVAVSNFPATQPISGTVTANQGAPNTAANGWFIKATDGTNTAAVKAASTAAVATDPALVVAISPNNTPVLPTGASTSALQTTGNTSLSTIVTNTANIPTVGQKLMASSLPVAIASNQSAIPTSTAANTNGSVVNQTLTGTTAQSNSPPTNTVGFMIEAEDPNTDNIRWRIGGTASTTAGMLMEPGRDSGYIPCSTAVSVCATVSTGTNAYSIVWVLSV